MAAILLKRNKKREHFFSVKAAKWINLWQAKANVIIRPVFSNCLSIINKVFSSLSVSQTTLSNDKKFFK